MEIKSLENETIPQKGGNGSDTGIQSDGTTSILKQGLDEEDSIEDHFIKEGIDEEMRGMDRFERGVDIPRPLPEPDHHHHY